jgi:hypothetical protein
MFLISSEFRFHPDVHLDLLYTVMYFFLRIHARLIVFLSFLPLFRRTPWMDKASSFFRPLVHRSLPLSSHTFPSPETAVRPSYGSCDRRYVKQVFDNLHGSISLDPLALQFVDTEEF